MPFKTTFAAAVASAAILGASAHAGTVTVVGDVNAPASTGTNSTFYEQVLGAGTRVLFTDGVGQQSGTRTFYNNLPGVTATFTNQPLTDSLLAAVDLLVVTEGFNNPADYGASELAAMADFAAGGGDLLLVLEASGAAARGTYDAILAAIGSEIRYTSTRTIVAPVSLNDTPVSSTADTFQTGLAQVLTGGISVAEDGNDNTFVAYEDLAPIPLPAGLPLLVGGLGVLAVMRRGTRG